MTLIESAIETFQQAAEYNLDDLVREGSMLNFPDHGQVVMTGDMHGHRRNFEKLVKYCQLEASPRRHVLMHEMIHADPESLGAADRSVELLLDAARWKTFFPQQVHFLQSNHELAQFRDHQITKGGRIVTDDFQRGVAEVLGGRRIDAALEAIDEFIASFPLAARTPNGILFSHSLPDVDAMGHFDPECVWRSPDEQDLSEGGSVYELVWGRRHSPELLDYLGSVYDVRYFIVGHRPQEYGYSIYHGRLVVLASDNNHGVFLPLDCQKRYTIDEIEARIRPFVGVV